MKYLTTFAALLGMAAALQMTSNMQRLTETLSFAQQKGGHNCKYAINRINNPKVNYTKIIGSKTLFRDTEFDFATDMVYWTDYPYASLNSAYNVSYTWDRVRNRISNATLFGKGISPNDIF